MFDFRLKVFHTVAKRLNFTKAAAELYITQPAVTKHIHELEHYFKVKLFERSGSGIRLTAPGETLLHHTEQIFSIYRNLEFEMNGFSLQQKGKLRIGASTTVAQYVLPQLLASFHKKFPEVEVTLIANNTEQIEKSLKNNAIDMGVVEGRLKNTSIKYSEFIKDEIVLVSSFKNSIIKRDSIQQSSLKNIPLLLREPGSGTLEVITHSLKNIGIKLKDLKVEMQLASTESIKSYIRHSDCMAFLSIYSVLVELQKNEFRIVDVKGLNIERYFYFIQLHGQAESLPELFVRMASRYNFR